MLQKWYYKSWISWRWKLYFILPIHQTFSNGFLYSIKLSTISLQLRIYQLKIKLVFRFGLFVLYGISTLVGYLIPNPRVFTNGLRDLGSIPGWVIPKIKKMVLEVSLLNTQHYKVWIKAKVEQFRERSSALLYTLV